ncbi:MAG: peptidylprolyl isomerase [Woeseia sp.]
MKALLKEPLLHFLAIGLGIFALDHALDSNRAVSDPFAIVVNRANLVSFLQNRVRPASTEDVTALLSRMSQAELTRLVEDYATEEAMYREAKALQLDGDDYLARLRAIQRLEFVTKEASELRLSDPAPQELEDYYQAHSADFIVEPTLTFTHVFFSSTQAGDASERAHAVKAQLNEQRIPFHEASRFGERFPYQLNYVDSSLDEVEDHFGPEMQETLSGINVDTTAWQGPLESNHGYHLVMLLRKTELHLPAFDEVRPAVERKLRQQAQERAYASIREGILEKYRVTVDDLLAEPKAQSAVQAAD